jgi:hypothetical protein
MTEERKKELFPLVQNKLEQIVDNLFDVDYWDGIVNYDPQENPMTWEEWEELMEYVTISTNVSLAS